MKKIKQGNRIKSVLGELIPPPQVKKEGLFEWGLSYSIRENPLFSLGLPCHLPADLRWPHQAEPGGQQWPSAW